MAKKSRGKIAEKKEERIMIPLRMQRRILEFFNRGRIPEDIVMFPNQGIEAKYDEHSFKGPGMHEPSRKMRKKKKDNMFDMNIARNAIEWREQFSPLLGFINIEQLSDITGKKHLDDIIIAFGPASYGQWTDPIVIPSEYDRPIHGALLNTGKVIFFGLPNGNNTFLWDSNISGAGAFSFPGNQPTDSLFCSGHCFLSDGKLLVVGGGGDGTGARHNHGWKFEPDSSQWARIPNDMHFFRWYPTCVTLGDEPGRVLIVSGSNTSFVDVPEMEVYSEVTNSFDRVWGPGGVGDTSANRSFPQLYPGLNLLPGGEMFYTPTGWESGAPTSSDYPVARPSSYFSFSGPLSGTWTNVGPIAIPPEPPSEAEEAIDRVKGMAVLLLQPTYPYVQVMVVGGGEDPDSTGTYQIINLSTLTPEWGPPLDLPDDLARVNVNLVLLPDGKVFINGGRPTSGSPSNGGKCWIYDPLMGSWYEMEELTNSRQYHSLALLLPSGKVMTAGNEWTDDRTIEVFSPPYLFNPDGTIATQPTISLAPELVHHGSTFSIETPDAANIEKLVFVRPMAVTHQTDSEQRVIPLPFTRTGTNTLTAVVPDGWHPHSIAPRGYYMLFIVDNKGTPSNAWMTKGGKFIYLH
jgi:hypothetical protein